MSKTLVLVLNCGSSSLKFSILNTISKKKIFFGTFERLYLLKSFVTWECDHDKKKIILNDYESHEQALTFMVKNIFTKYKNIINRIKFIGHRVVHGGCDLTRSYIINDNIIQIIKKNIVFAPSHNPLNLLGIHLSMKYFPNLSKNNVAVFDTAFYNTLPESAYLYAIPYYLYKDYNIRRYGAHGISHSYVLQQASKILDKSIQSLNIITCHLGGGSSISAIVNGRCVDTSMGLTPLEGLVMGTRSGNLDPSIIFFMNDVLNIPINTIQDILINKSGILGLTNGITSDFRYVEKNYYSENESYRAVNVFCYSLSKYISSYASVLFGKIDAVIFTGGIGENSFLVRKLALLNLKFLGLELDDSLNQDYVLHKSSFINKKSTIPILVIPTNEDLVIAEETIQLFS
ncbi:acetate/propionate family kinase [Buchnera aphidicola]|uniref:acetate/propionate family kinase n=1 Tax=Buchnera aphidicola TaxID=9 RepID=UPI003463A4F6